MLKQLRLILVFSLIVAGFGSTAQADTKIATAEQVLDCSDTPEEVERWNPPEFIREQMQRDCNNGLIYTNNRTKVGNNSGLHITIEMPPPSPVIPTSPDNSWYENKIIEIKNWVNKFLGKFGARLGDK